MRDFFGGDPYFSNVALQLPLRSHFRDEAKAPTLVTVNGDTKLVNDAAYFDGDGDYCALSSTVASALASGPVTIEGWLKLNATPWVLPVGNSANYGSAVLAQNNNSGSGEQYIDVGTNYKIFFGRAGSWSPSYYLYAVTAFTPDQWGHFAFVYTGSVLNLYINGKLDAQTAATTFWSNNGQPLEFARCLVPSYPSYKIYFNGYIRDFRITKGVRYTSNFTPPTALPTHGVTKLNRRIPLLALPEAKRPPIVARRREFGGDPHFNNVALQLPLQAHLRDESKSPKAMTIGGTPVANLGGTYFNGSSRLYTPSTTALNNPFTTDYTIEAYVRASNWASWSHYGDGVNHGRMYANSDLSNIHWWSFGPRYDGKLSVFYYGPGEKVSTRTLLTDTWHYVAMVVDKKANVLRLFIDGQQDSTHAIPSCSYSTYISVGYAQYGYITGYIRGLRITPGIARYTSNFTPPVALPAPHGVVAPHAARVPTYMKSAVHRAPVMAMASVNSGDKFFNNVLLNAPLRTDIRDYSKYTRVFTQGGGVVVNQEATYFDGVNDTLTSSAFDLLPYGDFTIEFEGKWPASAGERRVFAVGGGLAGWNSSTGLHLLMQINGTNSGASADFMSFQYWNGSSGTGIASSIPIPNRSTAFTRVVVQKRGSEVTMYFNSALVMRNTVNMVRPSATPAVGIFCIPGEVGGFIGHGWVRNVRVTAGVCRYANTIGTVATLPTSSVAAPYGIE